MRLRALAPPVLCILAISAMSHAWISSSSFASKASAAIQVSRADFDRFWDVWWWVFVKGFHFGEFALLFWLLHRALTKGASMSFREAIGWSMAVAGVFAAFDEFHQSFISYRGGRVGDVMIDIGGAVFASLVLLLVRERHRTSTSDRSSSPAP